MEITDRVKESVEQNGNKPELFGDIVRTAVALLERLIAKVIQKVMDFAEKVISKADNVIKETRPQPKPSVLAAKCCICHMLKNRELHIFVECHTLRKSFVFKELVQYAESIQNVAFFVKMP